MSSGLQLLILYSLPWVPEKDALKTIIGLAASMDPTNNPLLVLGDFNMELQSSHGTALVTQMESIHLVKISPGDPSSDYRTTIYNPFASISAASTLYESVFSDH